LGVSGCTDKLQNFAATQHATINYICTLEADSVMNALGKWIQMVEDGSASIGTLIGITNQRLVRKLCEECKEAYTPDPELLKKFNIPKDSTKAFYRAGKVQYDKKGRPSTCTNCQGTGYVGRIAILEVIRINDQLRKSIMNLKTLSEIARQFRAAKMLYLQEQMLKRVLRVIRASMMVRVLSDQRRRKNKFLVRKQNQRLIS
jgi:type IV pilus assembly protein PilB